MISEPRMTQEEKDRRFCIEALKSEECQCGRPKQRGRSVCFKCWQKLPDDLRRALYRKIGAGYEAAYDDACRFLND